MKYLVMECHEDYAILLDEEAGFVKASNTGFTVGETIENPELLNVKAPRRNIIMKVTSVVAAAAACLACVIGINYYNEYITPYSNIRLSINPDVEMTLNHHGQVLSVKGLNEDGKELIEGYDPKKQDKIAVADDLIERAIDMGYLSDDAIIIFDIDTPDKQLLTQYGIELRSEAEIYTREFANINIIIIDRNQDTSDDNEYSNKDYEPVVIPIPQQTEAPTSDPKEKQTQIKPSDSDTGYEENDDGDNSNNSAYEESPYIEAVTQATTTKPTATAPVQNTDVNDNSDYAMESDSNYYNGESDYDAGSNYNDSGYYTDN